MEKYKNISYIGSDFRICKGYSFVGSKGKNLILHKDTKVISAGAFYGCDVISNVKIPDGLEQINEDAFAQSTIENIEIKNKIKVKKGAFTSSRLTNILVNTETVPDKCFEKACIQNLKLESTVHIASDAFFCAQIKNISLPATLKSIGNRAFYGAFFGSDELIIPESVTKIGEYAFNGTNLKIIHLPKNLKYLDQAFINENCTIITDKEVYDRFPCLKRFKVKFTDLDNLIEEKKSFKEINNIYKNIETR